MISTDIQRVLDLQQHYSPKNTPEMKERGILVRQEIRAGITDALSSSDKYEGWEVEGRDGTGLKTGVPWVRVFRREFSPSVREGFDLVLLFATDGSSVYLSLNQGTTNLIKNGFVPKNYNEIKASADWAKKIILDDSKLAQDFAERLSSLPALDLGYPTPMAASYVPGDVLHFRYMKNAIPSDEILIKDLISLLAPLDEVYKHFSSMPSSEEHMEISKLDSLTNWPQEKLQELIESLTDDSPQVILAGPPGTGKTFVARHVAAQILGTPGELENPAISIVQFHPSYGYEQFIEGLQPATSDAGGFTFQNVPGVILRLVEAIENDGNPRVLIIDEMNRANLPRVFGELMYLLEYRDSEINLLHRESFSLPRELYIIGTMNTADRSTRSIDLALRRRFDFFDVFPDVNILKAHYEKDVNANELGEELFIGFQKLNELLTQKLGKHFAVGHSFFMSKKFGIKDVNRVWKHQVGPLIEEYFFNNPMEADLFGIKEFFPHAG